MIGATDLSLTQCVAEIRGRGGVAVPAHINRGSNGLLINLGMMPPEPDFHVVEVWPDPPALPEAVKDRRVLHASDAHQLGNIREAVFDIPPERFSFGGLWTWLHDFHR